MLTAIRRHSDEIPTNYKKSVGIPSVFLKWLTAINGHILSRQRSRASVGTASVYSDGIPTTVTVIIFVGLSSELSSEYTDDRPSSEVRRTVPTKYRRTRVFGFRRYVVGMWSEWSDDFAFRRSGRQNFPVFLVVSYQRTQFETDSDISTTHSSQYDFKTIEVATNNFSSSNKLGEGGFGEVYKGTLSTGTEVAVKRLSKMSGQGTREFRNEAVLVSKLQHRNLVRLLGFCLEGKEKILIYEFVPNKSLDYFLFDPENQGRLDWTQRYKIIGGIARGILYLHQDSQLTIIHRDLKASNILLDSDMVPKISDFGLSTIFGIEQTQGNTNRIAGTYAYMSPEYAMQGQFSMKSDIYSFGVLVLEIISGKKNSNVYQMDETTTAGNLVNNAWRLWRNGSPLDLLDPAIRRNNQSNEVTRCIHIALLCVQDNPEDRPMLSTIILMLTSNTITLPVPHLPSYFPRNKLELEKVSEGFESSRSTEKSVGYSVSDSSITDLEPR
ncbi:hypothetical protein Rs2_37884 [Raphanus sativus]|nr:hypothetical protein Rs2_37884 [Raphanus sativus]